MRDYYGQWSREAVGSHNKPRSREECEQDIEGLRSLGDEWTDAEYRIVEA